MHRHHSHAPAADAATLLKQATDRARQSGLRRTRALEDVLRMLIDAHRPLTLGDIAESSQLKSGADRATVYRLLMKLEERGIIRRLGLQSSRFRARRGT